MAQTSDERVPGRSGTFETLADLPPGIEIPPGVSRAEPKKWYVQWYTTKDGRTFYEFYPRTSQGEGKTDPVFATVQGPDNKEVKDAWDKEQEQEAKGPQGSVPKGTVRNIPVNGVSVPHVVTGHDERGQPIWEPVQTAAGPVQPSAPAATSARTIPPGGKRDIEGTPDASKPDGFDNERPRWVTRDANGKEVFSEPVTGRDLEDWHEARQRSRNPGRKTDAELAREQAANKTRKDPVVIDGKPYIKVTVATNGSEETYYTDEQGNRVPTPVPKEQRGNSRQPVLAPDKKSWGYWDDTDPANPKWVTIPPDKAPPLPGEPEKAPVLVEGVYGVWRTDKDGKPVFVPVENQPGGAKLPAGAPPIDTSSPQAAFDSYQRLVAWVHQQAAEGKIAPSAVRTILEAPHQQVDMILQREKDQRTTLIAQRGQDASIQTNALSNATSGLGTGMNAALEVAKYSGGGRGHPMNVLMGTLALQRAQAQNVGWNPNGLPQVLPYPAQTPGGVVPGPVSAALGAQEYPAILQGSRTAGAPVAAPTTPSEAAATAAANAAIPQPAPQPMTPGTEVRPAQMPAAADAEVRTVPLSATAPSPVVPGFLANGNVDPASPVPPGRRRYRDKWGNVFDYTPEQEAGGFMGEELTPVSPPAQVAPPVAPVMALGRSTGIGSGYEPAIASLKAMGLDDETINRALREFSMGV